MSTAAVSSSTGLRSAGQVSARGHVGLVVLGAIASGLLSGLLLVLVVLAGGPEHEIIGAALVAFGIGFVVLAVGSRRFTDQPQPWALLPGVASAVVGVAIWALAPSDRTLTLAGWVWPELLLVLVIWSFRGARQALHNWSRRALLYPSLFVLLLVAAGGAFQTVSEATSSNPAPDRSYLVDGHSLYLHCVGTGEPTVVLFNGLGENTELGVGAAERLVDNPRLRVRSSRRGMEWRGTRSPGRGPARLRPARPSSCGAHPRSLRARGAFRRRCLRPRLRRAVSARGCRCCADRLGNAISVRSPGLPGLLQHGAAPLFSDAHVRSCWYRQADGR